MLSTDPARETPLVLKERRPFSLTLTCLVANGGRLDLTGATLRMVIAAQQHMGGAVELTSVGTLVVAAEGTARFDIQADDLNFGDGIYDYAITLVSAEGYESTIVEGPLELTHNPDPTIPADHSFVVPPLSLTAKFRDANNVTVRINHHPDSTLGDLVVAAQAAATAAAASETDVAADAAAADASADAAAASASAAAASAVAADASADLAVLSADNAGGAATVAGFSASNASDSEIAAAASEIAAAGSATAAAGSATAAEGFKDDAEAAAANAAAVVASKADLASPVFTGDPKAPTPATADNDTSIATTAYVKAQPFAPLASPVLTGNPTGPTPATTDNDTSLATTAFVKAASSPLIAQGMELRESFTGMADGVPPTEAATRQAMTNYGPSGAAAVPFVRSGFLSTTTPNSAEGGAYRIAQLTGPVIRTGARFAFSSYTVDGGLLALSIQATSIALNASVPVSPLHFWISPTAWSLDVNDTAGTAVEVVASGTFTTALTADGATLHTVDIVLDRDRQKCYITFPNGFVLEVSDSRFALAGTFVYVEPFKSAGSPANKTNALVKEWWADARGVEILPHIRGRSTTVPVQPTLVASWTHTAGNEIKYFRENGKGRIKGSMAGGTNSNTIFTLPAATALDPGYRPSKDTHFPVAANAAFGDLLVMSNGSVMMAAGSNAWVSVDVTFNLLGFGAGLL